MGLWFMGPCDAISEPKIKSRNITTTISNVNAAPLEKWTKVELLLPAESVIWIWAQVDQFCDAKTLTQNSVNPHNDDNLRWFTNSAEWEIDQTFWFLPATQDDWKWEFFMSDFDWTESAESGPDRHIMLLDKVENWQHGCFLGCQAHKRSKSPPNREVENSFLKLIVCIICNYTWLYGSK